MPQLVEAIAVPSVRTSSRGRAIAGTIGLVLLLGACFWVHALRLRADVANRDFMAYWTTSRLLALHQNPYDSAAIFQMEKSEGSLASHAMVMRNPPWALFLAVPLGWFDAPTAGFLWLIAVIGAGLGSLQLIRPPQLKQIPLILIFFAPVLICVETEQTSLFVLLGLALFTSLEQKRPFCAGAALVLVLLKPHVLFIFLMVLALDLCRRRKLALLAGFFAGFTAANLTALAVSPGIWREYLASMRQEGLQNYIYPNMANVLRLLIGGRAIWPLALPGVVAAVWAVQYWWKHRDGWNWPVRMPLIAAISIFVAPYSYPYDNVLFWPAVLAGWPRASRVARTVLVVLNIAVMAVTLCANNVGSPLYLWTGPAWMLWCVYAGRRERAIISKDERYEVPAIAA